MLFPQECSAKSSEVLAESYRLPSTACMAHLLISALALTPSARQNAPTLGRRALLFGLPAAAVLTPNRAVADDGLLTTAGTLVNVLKPLYKLEAPLQAGSYDKTAVQKEIAQAVAGSPVLVFSYTLSPFCTEAKKILTDAGAKFTVIELGDEWVPGLLPANGAAI